MSSFDRFENIRTVQEIPKILSMDAGGLDNYNLMDDTPVEEKKEDEEKGSSEDEESSVDASDDEEAAYQSVLNEQKQATEMKEAKQKGEHLNDLVDNEMKQLLMRCKKFPLPTEAELKPRYVEFGENPEKKKTLVLDMDETLLHAKFAKDDDADFSFVL